MEVLEMRKMTAMSKNRLNVYAVDQHGNVTINYNKDDVPWVIFRATSQDKGNLFLEVYLALSLENRRKLVEAVK
jgi:hypothetical protein